MSLGSLEEDLRKIPGVEGAEIDGSGDTPGGLRIRIAEGADQRAVGQEIRKVLTKHGLGTDTRLPGEDQSEMEAVTPAGEMVTEAAAPEGVPEPAPEIRTSTVAVIEEDGARSTDTTIVDLTDQADDDHEEQEDGAGDDPDAEEPPLEEVVGTLEASPSPGSWVAAGLDPVDSRVPEDPSGSGVIAKLDRVAVEEARNGISVTVSTTDGRSATEPASSTEGGVEAAVVKAAAKLARPGTPDPNIVEIEDRRIEGVDVV
ncbi:MAG: hypothetical protein M3094_09095, partial [Actinomycetia bacterium]|nr:hypothetical protein [Actinomycetes bacterium]